MQTRRTGSRDLIPIDLEIEATIRKQGSKRRRNKNKQQEAMAEPPAAKPLWEYGVPDATTDAMSSILRPRIVTLNVSDDAIRLRLFPFSLRDRAKEWLKDEGIGTLDSRDKLVKAFLAKFLGQEKTTRLRTDLSTLRQLDYESLYEYWRRIYIDAALGGNFVEKVPTEVKALLEKMATNDNFHSGGRNNAKKRGKHEVDAMTLLTSTMQALSLKVDQLQAGPFVVASCETCGVQGHIVHECQYAEMLMEQANALYNNNQQRRPYDPYSNTYNEGWKQNSAFSYKNSQNQLNPPPPPSHNNFNHPPVQQIQSQTKLIENQISQLAQQVGQSSRVSDHFPSNTEQPPKGQINVVTLRNGRELEDLPLKVVQKKAVVVEEEMVEAEKMIEKEKIKEKKKPIVIEPYNPPMPSYAKFLKDINKRKIRENATVSLTTECSAILQNKLPKKLGDPGSYSIPVKLGDIKIKKALYELEDVPLRVEKFFILSDFMVMEMEEDAQVPIILGRPFLATVGATIDMKNGKITFKVGDEKMEYSLTSSMGSSSKKETIYRVDALDEAVEAKAADLQLDDSLQTVLIESVDKEDWETREYKRLLEETRVLAADEPIKEVLKPRESKESTTPPEVELNPSL
ncbi:uncharacterized protein LOC125371231 [Ricinus communis]|uniref:uncharacterized protein LOC125371231 n=1 Tax=Ricinus communis TaxID=3988 RepID=UPI00201A5C6F|nr:uncharacterized protein LOC125371231 [Ricinus communis]